MKRLLPFLALCACSPAAGVTPRYDMGRSYDPPYTYITLTAEIEDARIREAHPGFDGLEVVYAEVPGRGRIYLQWVEQWEPRPGIDVHSMFQMIEYLDEQSIRQNGVWFGVRTNVGELPAVHAP